MSAIEPISCRHDAALPARALRLHGRGDGASHPSPPRGDDGPSPRRGDDPGPEGPEAEPVGEEDEDGGDEANIENMPSPGPGMPVVPEHGSPDES